MYVLYECCGIYRCQSSGDGGDRHVVQLSADCWRKPDWCEQHVPRLLILSFFINYYYYYYTNFLHYLASGFNPMLKSYVTAAAIKLSS